MISFLWTLFPNFYSDASSSSRLKTLKKFGWHCDPNSSHLFSSLPLSPNNFAVRVQVQMMCYYSIVFHCLENQPQWESLEHSFLRILWPFGNILILVMLKFNQDSVPKMILVLCWSITGAISVILCLALWQFIILQGSFLLLFFVTSLNLLLLFCLRGSGLLEFDRSIPELNTVKALVSDHIGNLKKWL